jgi:hypothetical protein
MIQPRDEIALEVIKCQAKGNAIQDTMFGLKSGSDIPNLQDWLK